MKAIQLLLLFSLVLSSCNEQSTESQSPNEFFPLNVGNTWVYEVAYFDTSGVVHETSTDTVTISLTRILGNDVSYVFPFLIEDPYTWFNHSDDVYIGDPREGTHLVFKHPANKGEKWDFLPLHWGRGKWYVLSTDSLITARSSTYHCSIYVFEYLNGATVYVEFIASGIGIVRSDYYDPFSNKKIFENSLISYQLSPK